MLPKSSHWLWLIAIVFLLSSVWIWLSRLPEGLAGSNRAAPQIGFQAPDFVLSELGGEAIRLEELRGQPVILNFWASWCAPCRAEMPALEKIAQEYASKGLVMLLVNQGESEASITPFLEGVGISAPVLLDRDLTATSLYRVNALPPTFFIDKDGRIQDYIIGGPMTEAYLSSRVLSLIETP
jgi:thiol-disulfide isomerase/thioredoxin